MNQLECWAPLGVECRFAEVDACEVDAKCLTHLLDIEISLCSLEEPCLDRPLEYLHFVSRLFDADMGNCITLHTPYLIFLEERKAAK